MSRRAGTNASPDKPVFVDHSGRRRRALTLLGSGIGVLLVTGLIALLAGAFGGPPQSVPRWPDAAPGPANTSPSPSRSPDDPSPSPIPADVQPSDAPGNAKTDPPGNGNPGGKPSKLPGKPR